MRDVFSLPSYHVPQSNLDSATYRSFVRLLSRCFSAAKQPPTPQEAGNDVAPSVLLPGPEEGPVIREDDHLDPRDVARETNGDVGVPVAVELDRSCGLGGGGRSPVQDGVKMGKSKEEGHTIEDESPCLSGADEGVGRIVPIRCQNRSLGSSRESVQGNELRMVVDDDDAPYSEKNDGFGDIGGDDSGNHVENERHQHVSGSDSSMELGKGEEVLMVDRNGFDLPNHYDVGIVETQKEVIDRILNVSPHVDEIVDIYNQGDASEQHPQDKLKDEVEHVEGEFFGTSDQLAILKGMPVDGRRQERHSGSSTVAYHHEHLSESEKLVDESNRRKPHSVLLEAEISCPVEESNVGKQQVKSACVKIIDFGPTNSHKNTTTKPPHALNNSENPKGQEGHPESANIVHHNDHLSEIQESTGGSGCGKLPSVMPKAEVSCSMEESNDGKQKVKSACTKPIYSGSTNLQNKMTKPLYVVNNAEELKGQEGHPKSAAIAYRHDHLFENQEPIDEGNSEKFPSVMSEDEISCPVEESNDGKQQVKSARVDFGPRNSHENASGKPIHLVSNTEFEEGEIHGKFGGEIELEAIEDTLTRLGTDNAEAIVEKSDSFSKREDYIDGHDLAMKSNSWNHGSNIVDYSDLYQTGHASSGGKLSSLPESKKACSRMKKNGGDKLTTPPKTRKDSREKNDVYNVSFSNKSNIPTDISEKVSIPKLQKESSLKDSEDTEKNNKKKRGPLTDERKAKKKQAKKRKRAELNRKLGIKRLKILPVSVPKKVIYCDFYLKGRCQKGDLCSFSHDTTPLTKSQPCKYFACNSCLKGDDCPFDHELRKYPCHNFMSRGICSRGEECKFSHEVQVTEGSVENAASKLDTLKLSEVSSSGKPLKTGMPTSQIVNSISKFNTRSSEHEYSVEMAQKPEMKVPKGMHFLSFGKHQTENANKDIKVSTETLASGKQSNSRPSLTIKNIFTNNGILSTSEPMPSAELKWTPQKNAPKGIHFLSFGENIMDKTKGSEKKLWTKQSEAIEVQTKQDNEVNRLQINDIPANSSHKRYPYGSIKSDATDATKILEEFLFSGE